MATIKYILGLAELARRAMNIPCRLGGTTISHDHTLVV